MILYTLKPVLNKDYREGLLKIFFDKQKRDDSAVQLKASGEVSHVICQDVKTEDELNQVDHQDPRPKDLNFSKAVVLHELDEHGKVENSWYLVGCKYNMTSKALNSGTVVNGGGSLLLKPTHTSRYRVRQPHPKGGYKASAVKLGLDYNDAIQKSLRDLHLL